MEFNIDNTSVYGIERAVIASGNSYRTIIRAEDDINDKDWVRGSKLGSVDVGTGHDTFLNACLVTCDITAPLYWWKQAQRYHWLEFVSSQSTMHCVLKFNIKERCTKNVDSRIIDIIQTMINIYNDTEDKQRKEELWSTIIASLPCGFCLSATMTTNYRQLKTIYNQRKDHRLKEWHKFCDWCESLPHFKELCLKSVEK